MFGRIPKLSIDLVNDQTDSNELRDKIEVDWIASEFVDKQKAEMKAMFDLGASNRDKAALRASVLVDRTVRCANYQEVDKVWIMDENHKKRVNPKLRPKWKGPFTITEIVNEVDEILKADGCSHKTIIRHFSKLKKCIGKPFIAPMKARESTFDESHLINDASREEYSPALLSNTRQELTEDKSSSDDRSPSQVTRDP